MKKLTLLLFLTFLFLYHKNNAQCNNSDFESSAPGTYTSATGVTGWTISSQTATSCATSTVWTPGSSEFSLVSTPDFSNPYLSGLGHSPRGGTVVAHINDYSANSHVTRLTQAINVTTTNVSFQFCYAGIWENGGHTCCQEAGFKVRLIDQQGVYSACPSYTLGGNGCQYVPGYSVTSGVTWTDWVTKYIDLSPYLGTTVTIEVTVNDCTQGDHYGSVFFDAGCTSTVQGACSCTSGITLQQNMSCSYAGTAYVAAPLGYGSYQWFAPLGYPISASQSTLATLTLTNAQAGNIYTVNLTTPDGFCSFTTNYSLAVTPLTIAAIGAFGSCSLGASGSATVVGSGYMGGYNYLWANASNSVVGTNMSVNNLPAGVYHVSVTAVGSQTSLCGVVVGTVTVNTNTPALISTLKAFCNGEAYLSAPTNGANFKWYDPTLSAISSSLGGNSYSLTASSASTGTSYYLSYLSTQGCQDSIKFTLVQTTAGALSVPNTKQFCPGATNASITMLMGPAPGAPPGYNYFSVISTGTTSSYSSSLAPGTATNFTALNLTAGGTYSIIAFDGSCKYTQTLTVPMNVFDYTISPATQTVCAGNNIALSISYSTPPATNQYIYSWSPSTFIIGGSSANAIFSPTLSSGSTVTTIYSVMVTSTLANCSVTKTLSLTAVNLSTPTINPVPPLCANGSLFTLSASPAGGNFISNGNNVVNGQLLPSNSTIGVNTFSYAISYGPCNAKTTATYIVNSVPPVSVSGNTLVCSGQPVSFLANGANSYSWSTQEFGPVISVTPVTTTIYTLQGMNAITNCIGTNSITVVAVPYPTLSLSGQTLICLGATATLVASGADSYVWSNGSTTNTTNVSPLVNTTYTVTGTSSVAACSSTEAILVKLSFCTFLGVDKLSLDKLISVYPNPTQGKINIESETEVRFMLHDALGRLIAEEKTAGKNFSFDLKDFPNGIYFLKVYDKTESKILKLVKTD